MSDRPGTPDAANVAVWGCAAVLFGLAILALVSFYNWFWSWTEPSPPTAEEVRRQEIEGAEEERLAAQFQREQAPLWTTAPTNITYQTLGTEIAKCETAIRRSREKRNPHAMIFSGADTDALLPLIRRGTDTFSVMVQQHADIIDKVEVVRYTCQMRGSGFESFREGPSQFMERYVAN